MQGSETDDMHAGRSDYEIYFFRPTGRYGPSNSAGGT
jgi:hypothetical protein